MGGVWCGGSATAQMRTPPENVALVMLPVYGTACAACVCHQPDGATLLLFARPTTIGYALSTFR